MLVKKFKANIEHSLIEARVPMRFAHQP